MSGPISLDGWPATLTDEEIPGRLVALNAERAAEEARGLVRWLRPEFQAPGGASAAPTAVQADLPIAADEEPAATAAAASAAGKKAAWPKSLAEQAQAVRSALAARPGAVTPEQLARGFLRARADRVADLLETLASLGQAREVEGGRYVPS